MRNFPNTLRDVAPVRNMAVLRLYHRQSEKGAVCSCDR